MAEKVQVQVLRCLVEKSPALFVLPNKASLSPALETIAEEEETEDSNEKEGS